MNHFYSKTYGIFVLAFLLAQGLAAQPTITSFSPASGSIGTTVTITGTNFGATPTSNIVYFGAVKAAVSAATGTTLTVTVPAGTTYQPISITTGGLTAYSSAPFVVTFPGAYPTFSDTSFALRIDSSISHPKAFVRFADFDGDGKADIASVESLGAGTACLSIYKNTGTAGKISLATRLIYTRSDGDDYPALVTTDIDGDGLIDIVVDDRPENQVLVYLNTSSNGTISFANPVSIPNFIIVDSPVYMASGDLDGDGKPDIVLSNSFGDLSLFRNTSIPGNISFSPRSTVNAQLITGFDQINIQDFDGDGKPDIIVGWGSGDKFTFTLMINVLINKSTPGTFSFNTPVTVTNLPGTVVVNGLVEGFINGQAIGDLDGDGKPDIAITDSISNLVYIFRNTSSPGSPSVDGGVSYPGGNGSVSITDLDGDGKPDLATSSNNGLFLLKNKSIPGTISFASGMAFLGSNRISDIGMADLDGDGKPDLIAANASGLTLSIRRNKIGEALLTPSGSNPITGDVAEHVTVDTTVQQVNSITYVQRHYDIEPANNPATSTAHLKLYFAQADFDSFNATPNHGANLPTGPSDNADKANLRIYQDHGFSATNTPDSYSGSTIIINPTAGSVNWNPGTLLWEIDFDVTGFSGFFISSAASALPLNLLSFTATAQGNNALLKWTTANETNTSYFELQRSTDGSSFTDIAKINAAGNSIANLNYQYSDALGTDPAYYYRLKMVDIDGATSFSDIVKITVTSHRSPLGIYPNPARNYIAVEYPASNDAQLQLLDMSGKLLQQVKLPKNSLQTRLSIEGLAPGTYQIIWSDGTKTLGQSLLIL